MQQSFLRRSAHSGDVNFGCVSPQNGRILRSCIQFKELERRDAVVPRSDFIAASQLNECGLTAVRHMSWFHIKQRIKYVQFLLSPFHVLKLLAKCLKEFFANLPAYPDIIAGFCSCRVGKCTVFSPNAQFHFATLQRQ